MKKIIKLTALLTVLLIFAGGFASCREEECDCIEELGWSVRLKLKSQADESYLATEDSEIIDLVAKYDVIFEQTYSGFITLDLLLYYDITGK